GWVTLHPRHAVQGFSGLPRYSAIAETAHELGIPVIASGDLFAAEDGVRVLRQTGAAAVMYARGALRDPSVFFRHRQMIRSCRQDCGEQKPFSCGMPDPSAGAARLLGVMRRHIELARRFAPGGSFLKMRTFLPRYAKGLDGARLLRQEIVACADWDEMERALDRFGRLACGTGE
ncbi:MAG: tRNA-dihydrouridine synthase, partial [Mailhella sp.]|nr:tRNA-dihydrouridine synthase [Mailhella sp.]